MVLLRQIWRRSYHKCSPTSPTTQALRTDFSLLPLPRTKKSNLNRSTLKKDYARTLRVETIANSAGGTAAVAMVAQPSTGFLNVRYQPDGSPTEDTEDCLGRITVGLTRSKSLTLVVSPLDIDGPHRYGTDTRYAGLWCARSSTRSHHVGLALLQYESGTRKQQPNGKMVPQCGTFVGIPL